MTTIVRLPHDNGPKPHGDCITKHISEYPEHEQKRMLSARDLKAEAMRRTAIANKDRDEKIRKRYKERMKR